MMIVEGVVLVERALDDRGDGWYGLGAEPHVSARVPGAEDVPVPVFAGVRPILAEMA
jgi:hypothetical protein